MKATITENRVLITTGISAEAAKKAYAPLHVTDEKGNELYKVTQGLKANISPFGITCNTVENGELAAIIVFADGTDVEAIKHEIGSDVVKAQKFLPVIAATLADSEAAVNAAFEA